MHKLEYMESFVRELKFALKDRIVVFSLIGITLLSIYSLTAGLQKSAAEMALIERTENLVTQDRKYNLAKQSSAGGAAYYAFHFTYSPPSSLSFVSRGVRDDLPWKHRIRLLALEGQIYETDADNPELSKIGKLDFAFIAAFLLPLLSILLLYDLRAVEMRSNRWAFLSVTVKNGQRLLLGRSSLRSLLLYLAVIIPFIILSIINNADFSNSLLIAMAVALNCLFWCILAYFIFSRIESGPSTAALLLGCWFIMAVAIPVGGKYVVEQSITVPKGGEILLMQREAVNDAWDLPKETTMTAFLERHPQWNNTARITRPFEWKWYYAFQQVGDQRVETLSNELHSNIKRRDDAMSWIAIASPILLTERLLSQAAQTDVTSFQDYDRCVRSFHRRLRDFHYPMLFGDVAFSAEKMSKLPNFEVCSEAANKNSS